MTELQRVDILIVDDNPKNLLALEAILEDLGGNLVKANSGSEALRRLLEQDFALIMLDIQMPDMDGFETAALIRQRQRSRHTPIIFLTAFSRSDEQVFQGYSLGAVDYLFKPVVPEILKSKVAVFVDLYRNREEVRRQAEQLREAQKAAHERHLVEEKQRWESQHLREEMEKERRVAEALAQRAGELARTVAERERAEAALRQSNEQLQRISEELVAEGQRKDEFLAMLGHELRNPLAPISNAVQLLRLRRLTDPVVERSLEVMDRQVKHIVRLVDDLLDISRITRGKAELRKEPVDFHTIIEQAIQISRPLVQSRKHHWEMFLPDGPIWLDADPTRLLQVVANLLNNAAKYTEPGGHISLHVDLDGGQLVMRVKDSGIGIRPELLERVFDLFVQADRTIDRAPGGLGVGLTLVRRLVEMHGGSVTAYSAGLGKGSEFTVRLPASLPVEDTQSAGPMQVAAAGGEPVRDTALDVVVVDDNADVRESLRDILELYGHRVQMAEDGHQGVELVLSGTAQLALIDIGLPGLDGYGVARTLRVKMNGKQKTRLIALTGYGQPEDRARALEAGFDAHLVKPVNMELLQKILREATETV